MCQTYNWPWCLWQLREIFLQTSSESPSSCCDTGEVWVHNRCGHSAGKQINLASADKCCCIIEKTRYQHQKRLVSICWLVMESHTFKAWRDWLILYVGVIKYVVFIYLRAQFPCQCNASSSRNANGWRVFFWCCFVPVCKSPGVLTCRCWGGWRDAAKMIFGWFTL